MGYWYIIIRIIMIKILIIISVDKGVEDLEFFEVVGKRKKL